MDKPLIRQASIHDIPDLLTLVNNAYRGDEARKGWTHEADLIAGTIRIDEPSLRFLIENPNGAVLTCCDSDTILGCVYLEIKGVSVYLGMLTVQPDLQNSGIGKLLLGAADEFASTHHCESIQMTVISDRHELISWYERRGYADTGQTQPFPDDGRFGKPAKKLVFRILEKKL